MVVAGEARARHLPQPVAHDHHVLGQVGVVQSAVRVSRHRLAHDHRAVNPVGALNRRVRVVEVRPRRRRFEPVGQVCVFAVDSQNRVVLFRDSSHYFTSFSKFVKFFQHQVR